MRSPASFCWFRIEGNPFHDTYLCLDTPKMLKLRSRLSLALGLVALSLACGAAPPEAGAGGGPATGVAGSGTTSGGMPASSGASNSGSPAVGSAGAGAPPSGGAAIGGHPQGGMDAGSGGVAVGGAGGGGGSAAGSSNAAGGSTSGGASAGGNSAGGTPASGGAGAVFPAGVSKPRLMIVGDSISAGPGCYKKYLLAQLQNNGYSKLEFVGQYNDDCGGGVRHSAVSCSTAQQYTQATFTMSNCSVGVTFPGLSTLVATHNPDLLMLQLGVNDLWGGKNTQQILRSYSTLVQQARAHNPNIVIVVAQINKIRPDCSNQTVLDAAQALVSAVPAWAAGLSTAQSRVFTADLWTTSDWSKAETLDCVHPNDVGAQKMGLNWYNALKNILPK